MSKTNKPMATDALATLGTIIDANQKRDAIHLAVIPAEAGEDFSAGRHVCLIGSKAYGHGAKLIGIADPFIKNVLIKKGDWFWLILYPRTITSLRHAWTHPDIPAEGESRDASTFDKYASEQWLRAFCENADCPGYEQVMAAAQRRDAWSKEYLHFDGMDAHGAIPPEFWIHYQIVTGEIVPKEEQAEYFSCSC